MNAMSDDLKTIAKMLEQVKHLREFFDSEEPASQEDIEWVKGSLQTLQDRLKELQVGAVAN